MVLEEVKIDELNKIFDKNSKNVFDFLLQRTVISYPEFLPGQNNTALYLEKKQCEQWVVQSLGLKPVGEGSYPIDGINDKNGYDVSSLALGQTPTGKMKKQTGEKSLSQKFEDENFGDENDNLDSLFNSEKYDEIIKAWKNILKKKWEGTIKDQNLNDLYLINLILYKPENKLMIFLLKINHNNLDEVTKGKVSPKKTSVWFNNFIDEKFGNVKVYKSKKRVELRICPQEFIKNKSFLNFDINNKIDTKNLREIFENKNKKNKYLLKQSKRIKKFFSKLKD
jgi:hypothetical protein